VGNPEIGPGASGITSGELRNLPAANTATAITILFSTSHLYFQ
jgi:hypothetical protein